MKYSMFEGYDYASNAPIYEEFHPTGTDAHNAMRSQEAADISNWNKMLYENAYNSPTEQIKRLEEAGLNPLYYLGGNAGTTPSASAPGINGQSPGSKSGWIDQLLQGVNTMNAAVSTGKDFRQMMLNYDVQKEQNDIARINANANAALAGAQVPYYHSLQDYYDYAQTPKTQREIAQIDQQIKNLVAQEKLTEQQAKEAEANTQQLTALEAYYREQIKTQYTVRDVNRAMVGYYGSMSNYYSAIADPMANQLQEQAGMSKEQARLLSHQATNAIYQGNILQFQAYLYNKYGENEKIANIANIWTDTAYKGTEAINGALDAFFNASSGGLYGGFKGSISNPVPKKGVSPQQRAFQNQVSGAGQ